MPEYIVRLSQYIWAVKSQDTPGLIYWRFYGIGGKIGASFGIWKKTVPGHYSREDES